MSRDEFMPLTISANPALPTAHLRRHDVAIACSATAASRELRTMLEAARRRGNATIALLGDDAGDVRQRDVADCTIVVRSEHTHRVAEVQCTIQHTLRHAIRWLQRE